MFAILTGTGALLVMTPSWQVLAEVVLPAPAPGSRGALAWRPDAQYLAVATVDAASGVRMLRVLTNDLALHSEGRNEDNSGVPNLHAPLAWSADSALIGAVQSLRGSLRVVFFERNGLRHGEFTLPGISADAAACAALAWSASSELLAVQLVPADGSAAWSVVQVWHRDNYRWYCKHEARTGAVPPGTLPSAESATTPTAASSPTAPGSLAWDAEVPLRLRSVSRCQGGVAVQQVDFALMASVSQGPSTLAALADGASVDLTPLAYVLTPPPAAYATLAFPAPVSAFAFEPAPPPSAAQVASPPDREMCTVRGAGVGDATDATTALLEAPVLPSTGDSRAACLTSDGMLYIVPCATLPPRHPRTRPGASLLQPPSPTPWQALGPSGKPQPTLPGALPDMGHAALSLASATVQAGHPPSLHPDLPPSCHFAPASLRQLTWLDSRLPTEAGGVFTYEMAALAPCPAPGVGDVLVHFTLTVQGGAGEVASAVFHPVPLGTTRTATPPTHAAFGTAVRMVCLPGASPPRLMVHTTDCAVWGFTAEGGWAEHPETVLPEVCTDLHPLPPSSDCADADRPLAALSTISNRLYVNHVLLSPSVSSAATHTMAGGGPTTPTPSQAAFLFFTTLGPVARLACVSRHTLALLLQATDTPRPDGVPSDTPLTSILRAPAPPPTSDTAAAPPPAASETAHGSDPGSADFQNAVSVQVGAAVAAAGAWDAAGARSVERGARLVALTPAGTRAVLQLPRGNLEAVSPRVLTLTLVRHLLDTRQFGQAIEVCRRHRIDMALVADHDPAAFRAWAPAAVTQLPVTASDRWDLLLTAVGRERVTDTKYPPPPDAKPVPEDSPPGVDAAAWQAALEAEQAACSANVDLCDNRSRVAVTLRAAMRFALPAMAGPAPPPLFLSLLTTYTQQSPPDVGAALQAVRQLLQQQAGTAESPPPPKGSVTPASALKYLAVLVSADALWEEALATYDLGLMQLVAECVGRDPRSTVPLLQRLVNLARQHSAHACYAVDALLSRWPCAVEHAATATAHALASASTADQWSACAAALHVLAPTPATAAAQTTCAALQTAGAEPSAWALALDSLLPDRLPAPSWVARVWPVGGAAGEVDAALAAPLTTLLAIALTHGRLPEAVAALQGTPLALPHRMLSLLWSASAAEVTGSITAGGSAARTGGVAGDGLGAARYHRVLQTRAVALAALQPLQPPPVSHLLSLARLYPSGTLGTSALPVAAVQALAHALQAHPHLEAPSSGPAQGGAGGLFGDDDDGEGAFEVEGGVASEAGPEVGAADTAAPVPACLPHRTAAVQGVLDALLRHVTSLAGQYTDNACTALTNPSPALPPHMPHPLLHRHAIRQLVAVAADVASHLASSPVAALPMQVAVLCGMPRGEAEAAAAAAAAWPKESAAQPTPASLPTVQSLTVSPMPDFAAALERAGGSGQALLCVLTPALLAAAKAWCAGNVRRGDTAKQAAGTLCEVRTLRSELPLHDLVAISDAVTAAAAAAAADAAETGGGGAAGGEGGAGADWDDAGSVWSDASSIAGSVWSSASDASLASTQSRASVRSAVTDASDLLSVASAASTGTVGTARTDGQFSHRPRREYASITFDRSSGGFDSEGMAKRVSKDARKKASRAARKQRKAAAHRKPGGDRQQRQAEAALLHALPHTRWQVDGAELRSALAACADAVAAIAPSVAAALHAALQQVCDSDAHLLACIAELPTPPPREEVPGVTPEVELLAMREHAHRQSGKKSKNAPGTAEAEGAAERAVLHGTVATEAAEAALAHLATSQSEAAESVSALLTRHGISPSALDLPHPSTVDAALAAARGPRQSQGAAE